MVTDHFTVGGQSLSRVQLCDSMYRSTPGFSALHCNSQSLLRCLDSKHIKPVTPKGNQLCISLDRLMLELKLQYFGHLM